MRRTLLIALLALVACTGCVKDLPVPVGRRFHTAIDQPFRRYVAADASLTPEQRKIRYRALDDFDAALKKAGG